MWHGQYGEVDFIIRIPVEIPQMDFMSGHEREEVLLGKHGCLGSSSGATSVTERKALLRIHLKLLMADRTFQWLFLHQFPEIEHLKLLL